MHIKITEKKILLSHEAGTQVLIPGTDVSVKIYPGKISLPKKEVFFFNILGPVQDFTILQNWDNFSLDVYGHTLRGYFRYQIFQKQGKIMLHFDRIKFPSIEGIVKSHLRKKTFVAQEKDTINLNVPCCAFIKKNEVLSLGFNKTHDITLLQKRCDMKEILPLWFYIGSQLSLKEGKIEGNLTLLKEVETLINEKKCHLIEKAFEKIYLSSFDKMFSPKIFDDQWLAMLPIVEKIRTSKQNPLIILQKGALLIKRLFVEYDAKILKILPCLPPSFCSGRFIGIENEDFTLNMQWAKGQIFTLILSAKRDCDLRIIFPREIKSFRLKDRKNKERTSIIKNARDDNFKIQMGEIYYFDRFQK